MAHTPTPYTIEHEFDHEPTYIVRRTDGEATEIACLPASDHALDDARYLITAANAHDNLLRALNIMVEWQETKRQPTLDMHHFGCYTGKEFLAAAKRLIQRVEIGD